MEIWTFTQFLTLPYESYGHLATIVTCVQLWWDTEPYGLYMHPASQITWTPDPLSCVDISLME
jgi:hypothetical protein